MRSPADRFYVHSQECWGGSRVWFVFERGQVGGWKTASKAFRRAKDAERLCARMNADFVRYRVAMWAAARPQVDSTQPPDR